MILSEDKDKPYRFMGRKVCVTSLAMLLTTFLAYMGKLEPDAALIFTAAIGSFNFALRNTG